MLNYIKLLEHTTLKITITHYLKFYGKCQYICHDADRECLFCLAPREVKVYY